MTFASGMTAFFRGFLAGFHQFSHGIATIVNGILLSVVYFIGIGVSALILKFSGKHFLDMTLKKNNKTYWIEKQQEKGKEQYYRMF